MKRRPRKKKKSPKKKDSIKVKIPENCYTCAWRTKSSVVKIKCTKKDAEVIKEDAEWMCGSYSGKKMIEEITIEKKLPEHL